MSLNSKDDHTDKKALQPKTNLTKQSPKTKKVVDKKEVKKEWKKKWKKEWSKKNSRENSPAPPAASGSNATKAIDSQKKKKKARDTTKVICYNCNKKAHYANKYLKLKKLKN